MTLNPNPEARALAERVFRASCRVERMIYMGSSDLSRIAFLIEWRNALDRLYVRIARPIDD
jgi:chromosome condensin MukBEF MukE localization factor